MAAAKDKNKTLRREISDEGRYRNLRNRAFYMTDENMRKGLRSGSPGFSYDPSFQGQDAPVAMYSPRNNEVVMGPRSGEQTIVHELAHYLWSKKMSKKDKMSFLDRLHRSLREKNVRGESIEDVKGPLMGYEKNVAKGRYRGDTEERGTEWYANVAESLPSPGSSKDPRPPIPRRPREIPSDELVGEKYPELGASYKNFLSSQFLRDRTRTVRPTEYLSAKKK